MPLSIRFTQDKSIYESHFRVVDKEAGRGIPAQLTVEVTDRGEPVNPPHNSGGLPMFFRQSGGNPNITGAYTLLAPGVFMIAPPADQIWWVYEVSVRISDSGMNLDLFGALNALTNGILFQLNNSVGAPVIDLLGGIPIRTNADVSEHIGEAVPIDSSGATNDLMVGRFEIKNRLGRQARLDGSLGQRLEVIAQDSMVGLTVHRWRALVQVIPIASVLATEAIL